MSRRFNTGLRLRPTWVAVSAVIATGALACLVPVAAAAAGSVPRAVTSSGGWTSQPLPDPPGAAANSFTPVAISCPSITQCHGGGRALDSVMNNPAVLLTLSAGKWTSVNAPLPADAVKAKSVVASMSCPTTTRCFAGGDYQTNTSNTAMLLAWSGTKWTAARAPLPANANASPNAQINGMSCPSVSWCTAVGDYGSGGNLGYEYGLLLRWSGGKWTPAAAPVPAGAVPGDSLFAVSCPSTSRCFAGGWQDVAGPAGYTQQLLMLTWAAGKWARVAVPLPSGAAANPQAAVSSVACPTVTRCMAVGSYMDTAGHQQAALLAWSGTNWTARRAPLPTNAGSNPWASLNTVSCPTSTLCTAGGRYENAASTNLGLLLTWSAGHWKAAQAPAIAYNLYGLSCPAVSKCFAIAAAIGRGILLSGP